MNSNPTISPAPAPAPGAQTTSPSGQAAQAAISVKPDAAGGAGGANTNTMNTRDALIDALANRCHDRAGKPDGAVENTGTSEGAEKGWISRKQKKREGDEHIGELFGLSKAQAHAEGTSSRAYQHWKKTGFGFKRLQRLQAKAYSRNCTARDVIADRKAALNSGTSEGVRKSWLHRLRSNLGASKSTGDAEAESGRITKAELAHDDEERDKDIISEEEYGKMSHPEKMHFHSTMAKLHRGVARRISRMHPGDKTSKYPVMHFINYHKDEAERHTKGFRLHKHLHEGKASNSTMLAQMSPSPMIGDYARGERKAKNAAGSDSVRWAREFLRKSRAQPGKPKVDSTKWAREALVALKAHKSVTNDHRAEALEAGIRVELEHGPDRALAEKIARDHLREDPEYYAKLKRCGVK